MPKYMALQKSPLLTISNTRNHFRSIPLRQLMFVYTYLLWYSRPERKWSEKCGLLHRYSIQYTAVWSTFAPIISMTSTTMPWKAMVGMVNWFWKGWIHPFSILSTSTPMRSFFIWTSKFSAPKKIPSAFIAPLHPVPLIANFGRGHI